MNEINDLISNIINKKYISFDIITKILLLVKEIMMKEPNILYLNNPINIIGSIHGNFNDLNYILNNTKDFISTKFLFLGNIVDRHENSIECLILIFLLKIKYPKHFYILRGSHENKTISEIYGLYDECLLKYNGYPLFNLLVDVFNYFPLCAIINNNIFASHSGIPFERGLEDIKDIDRIENNFLDIKDIIFGHYKHENIQQINVIGPIFTEEDIEKFLKNNNLSKIINGNNIITEGITEVYNNKLIQIFSCSNFLNKINNKAGIISINNANEITKIIYNKSDVNKYYNNLSIKNNEIYF